MLPRGGRGQRKLSDLLIDAENRLRGLLSCAEHASDDTAPTRSCRDQRLWPAELARQRAFST